MRSPALDMLALCFLVGCPHQVPGPREQPLGSDIPGISGLTVDDHGTLWAVPEEHRFLLRIDPSTAVTDVIPLEGVPEGLETEALTWMGNGRFALGTEVSGDPRPHDQILMVRFDGEVARVEERVQCPYALWGLEGLDNSGIEGICAVDGGLVVAAEVVGTIEGRRFAPFARLGPTGQWTSFRVWLTTPAGKISGLACRPLDHGRLEIFAIERHFGVLRLLRIELPPTLFETTLEPQIVSNLDTWVGSQDPSPNFEGISFMPDGWLAFIADNHYGGQHGGDTALYWLHP